MIINPFVLVILMADLFVLGVTLALAVVHLKKTADTSRSDQLIEEARQKARQVVEDAYQKAAHVEQDVQTSQETLKQLFVAQQDEILARQSQALAQVSSTLLSAYEVALKKAIDDNINLVRNTTNEIETSVKEQISQFQKQLEQETVAGDKALEEKIKSAYATMEEELKQYRQERLKKVDENIGQIILDVSERVLGKALSLKDHEELVLESLERAKKEGILPHAPSS